jgi:hypothetical protein
MSRGWTGTAAELLWHLAELGADVRLDGGRLSWVPPDALTPMEAAWLERHPREGVRALLGPDPSDVGAFGRWLRQRWGVDCVLVGDAGPAVTSWMPRPQRPSRPTSKERIRQS